MYEKATNEYSEMMEVQVVEAPDGGALCTRGLDDSVPDPPGRSSTKPTDLYNKYGSLMRHLQIIRRRGRNSGVSARMGWCIPRQLSQGWLAGAPLCPAGVADLNLASARASSPTPPPARRSVARSNHPHQSSKSTLRCHRKREC